MIFELTAVPGVVFSCPGPSHGFGQAPQWVLFHRVWSDRTGTQVFVFSDIKTRAVFKGLTTVKGVGPTKAIGLIENNPGLPDVFQSGTVEELGRLRGLSPKSAPGIWDAVRSSLGLDGTSRKSGPKLPPDVEEDVNSALRALGYKVTDIRNRIAKSSEKVKTLGETSRIVEAYLKNQI